jgi:hypothetical protein
MKTLRVSPLVLIVSAYLARAQSDPEAIWAKASLHLSFESVAYISLLNT